MPKIIVSASGMATGGRVIHHLKHYLPDPRSTVLFAGFQAEGTRGAAMLDGAATVKIHGGYVPVRAEIDSLPMLSAHADADEILRWLRGFERAPRKPSSCMASPAPPRAAPAHQGRAGLALPGGGAERRGGAGLNGGAALPARRRLGQSFQAVARALGQRSLGARGVQREGRRTPGLRRGDQLPGPQGVAAQAFGRHGQSGAGAGRVQRGLIVGQNQRRRFGIARVDLLPVGRQRRGGPAGRSAAGPGRGAFRQPAAPLGRAPAVAGIHAATGIPRPCAESAPASPPRRSRARPAPTAGRAAAWRAGPRAGHGDAGRPAPAAAAR